MKIGVIFSGSGVYDGTEIQEGVFTLLSIKKVGADAVCFAPDINQHHVVNHITGEEMKETRNVLVESARITRGDIQSLDALRNACRFRVRDYDWARTCHHFIVRSVWFISRKLPDHLHWVRRRADFCFTADASLWC